MFEDMIKKHLGKSKEDLSRMTSEEIRRHVGSRIAAGDLQPTAKKISLQARGNMLGILGRTTTSNRSGKFRSIR